MSEMEAWTAKEKKWEVWTWKENGNEYEYLSCYSGDSFLAALYIAWQAKRSGCGCVKIEWR